MVAVGAVALGLVGAAVMPASATAPRAGEKPTATDVGVTATEIHIGVIADVDNAIVPGVFQPVVDGVNGAVKVINKGGGIAGRKLVVDFLDSKLNPNDARNGIITACSQDFALVGTAALFMGNIDDMISCKDVKGAATGLPDFGAVITNPVQACAPIEFPILPNQVLCSTLDQDPRTYQGYTGASKYLLKKYGKLHGAFIAPSDTKDAYQASYVLGLAVQKAGVASDAEYAVSARAPQSAYTPIVAKMKQDGSNFGYGAASAAGGVQLRSEAQLQGLDPKTVWLCNSGCYSKQFTDGGSAVDGEYINLPFLPVEDAKSFKPMATFVQAVGADKVQSFALYGYGATLAFQAALEAAVKKGGVNNVTRASLLEGAKSSLTAFNAQGLFGTEDLVKKIDSSCFALIQINGGKWKRVEPTKAGTFNCSPKNYTTLQYSFK